MYQDCIQKLQKLNSTYFQILKCLTFFAQLQQKPDHSIKLVFSKRQKQSHAGNLSVTQLSEELEKVEQSIFISTFSAYLQLLLVLNIPMPTKSNSCIHFLVLEIIHSKPLFYEKHLIQVIAKFCPAQ